MTVFAALVVAAAAIAAAGPVLLTRAGRTRLDPVALLIGWVGALAMLGLLTALAIVALLLPLHADYSVTTAFGDCWSLAVHGTVPQGRRATGAALAALIAGSVVISGVRCVFVLARRRAVATLHCDRIRLVASPAAGDGRVWCLEHDAPLAFAIAAPRGGMVVISRGLQTLLAPSELAAVLAHEHAHLRGRHHLIVAITEVIGQVLRPIPLCRNAPSAVRELVEAIADGAAARRYGAATVHRALLQMASAQSVRQRSGTAGRGPTLAMATTATSARARRLQLPAASRSARVRHCGAVAAATALGSAATVALAALVVSAISCPAL